jgi:hypothetical protein
VLAKVIGVSEIGKYATAVCKRDKSFFLEE